MASNVWRAGMAFAILCVMSVPACAGVPTGTPTGAEVLATVNAPVAASQRNLLNTEENLGPNYLSFGPGGGWRTHRCERRGRRYCAERFGYGGWRYRRCLRRVHRHCYGGYY